MTAVLAQPAGAAVKDGRGSELPRLDNRGLRGALIGASFLNPVVDYLLIGGALSLLVLIPLLWSDAIGFEGSQRLSSKPWIQYLFFFSNSAHFASSTVRLYSKPGANVQLPFLSAVAPWVAFGLLWLCVASPVFGRNLQSLYLSWSPYHYAAQAYGLAVMYTYRSGSQLQPREKTALWWAAMVPFLYVLLTGGNSRAGILWLIPPLSGLAAWHMIVPPLRLALQVGAIVAPLAVFASVWRSTGRPMPLISPLLLLVNSFWWLLLSPEDAFFVATIFHGIQYLAILMIFDAREHAPAGVSRLKRSLRFYAVCALLGYGLFHVLPHFFELAGYGLVEAMIAVVAIINVHHFLVDAYIWRLKPSDSNRKVIDSALAQGAA